MGRFGLGCWGLNQDEWDGRMDQDLGMNQDEWDERMCQDRDLNQDSLRRRSGYGMRGWAKIFSEGREESRPGTGLMRQDH
ncbi:Uncharacterised protein [Sphingobacterium mizutaii]|uniref:Uncharacterized protein n=1 Tax=Sphingobacterium mizutaii TaxID=1010 RepID=A0AAJ4X951_9SPHI|nr:hypothetical protein [Sphingobacterium mizutaii]SDL75004.1 hypothetical protein SAMN05192578_10846 [Sphingobacterium mizutaii]SNV42632.1 Uncharacterised protein [Sphingobacterium mizutaii]